MPELTLEDCAAIHAASFTHPRPWTAAEIASLLAGKGSFLATRGRGFVMGRVILDEVELLTIAVDPSARRQGLGRQLLDAFAGQARAQGAVSAFLEVAADNPGAIALYEAAGWRVTGRRRGYYRDPTGQAIDAILMACDLSFVEPNAQSGAA